MNKPNILFITIDTLRADWLGCYGHKRAISPHIDMLAKQSIRFEQAITGGSWTQAAFPVMMTSTYASMYGGCLGPLSAERPSPIETLALNGYKTAAFSTSPLLSKVYGYDRGFDQFHDLLPGEKDPALRHMKGGQRLLRSPITHLVSNLIGVQTRPAKIYVTAEDLTTEACRWIGETSEPFFGWVHYMDVHWPYHKEDELTKPQEIAQAWHDMAHLHNVNFGDAVVTQEQRDHYIELYEEAIAYTDAQVGRILDHLQKLALLDDTIVLLVSDHGEEFLERGYWGHVEINLYDEILRVPMLLKLPGQARPLVIPQQVRLLDIMPTLLALADVPAPEQMLGTSMTPLWEGMPEQYGEPISISERWRDDCHVVAVRTNAYKYIWNREAPDEPLLFDLRNDPQEKVNIALQKPGLVEELHGHVLEHLERVKATAPDTAVSEPTLDEDVLNRLRDLGYVE